jgi:MoaA/NifB/PqqE/SkfB family radical SAM enzyme
VEKQSTWIAEPFLHVEQDRIYNPITDRSLHPAEAGFLEMFRLHAGHDSMCEIQNELKDALINNGWLIANDVDWAARFLLKYVTLEATTACNQACYFCPVSIHPREAHSMPLDVYANIVEQLSPYRATIEAVFMINYNEPTIDRLFVERVKMLISRGLPPAVNTNATGLTPDKVDAILAMGGLRYLSVNLSTMDNASYLRDRGQDHAQLVLRNLDYLRDKQIAKQMDIAVLGTGDQDHQRNYREIAERFSGTTFSVKYFEVTDRAGHLPIGFRPARPHSRLRGCDSMGSRPLQHLLINAYGKCVLCCQDYDEKYEVGDLSRQSVHEVLTGPELSRLRRWSYGLEEAPADFICRNCVFARAGDDAPLNVSVTAL